MSSSSNVQHCRESGGGGSAASSSGEYVVVDRTITPLEGEGGMEVPSESFVYIDDNGDTVAPEEETSWLMALGIRGHGDVPIGDHANNDSHQGEGDISGDKNPSSSVTNTTANEVSYFEDPAEFEQERLLAEKRFEDFMHQQSVEEEEDESETVASEADVEDHEGMLGCRTFSREATCRNDEEEWILERILDKRVLRKPSSPTGLNTTDFKVFYDDFGNKETVIMAAGRTEYLCKWKWYVEPTWEGKELLEDEGFIRECRAFEATLSAKTTASTTITAAIAKVAPLWSDLHPEYAVKPKRKKRSSGIDHVYTERVFGDLTALSAISGLNMAAQACIFKSKGMTLYRHGVCATDDQISAFMKEFKSKRKTHRPLLLYHGSQLQNISSICRNGLRVPKTQRDVTNGQAYGKGIYAAYDPSVSVSFCRSAAPRCRMLLCVALVSPTDTNVTMIPGYCVVFKTSSLILPVMALDVTLGTPYLGDLERQIHSYETLSQLLPPKCKVILAAAERKQRDLFGSDSPFTMEHRARAMCKVRNKNILNINRLAEKAAAAAASATFTDTVPN